MDDNGKPRCPFRVKAFDQPDTCDSRCAWLMTDVNDDAKACAVAVIAMNVGKQMNVHDVNSYVIENEVYYYDNLARSHPWMRDMADETKTVGDLISQRTEEIEERNLLIAKARNSFKSLADCALDADRMRKGCRLAYDRMDEEMERMGISADGRAIETLNVINDETNGIYADVPLVDELPEGDAVAIMRKAAKGFVGGTGHVMKNAKVLLGINKDSGCDSVVLDTLADMVERDYVRRESVPEELWRLLDEFEHECFMIRVEASETRAKDEVVREAYERQREKTAWAISATLSDGGYEARMDELLCRLTNGKWSKSRSYSVDFMVSCVDEAYEEVYAEDAVTQAEVK